MRVIDIIGHTSGDLTVVSRVENTHNGQARYLCRCVCGNEKVVIGSSLRSKRTKSCGCKAIRATVIRSTKHGHSPMNGKISPTYHTWGGMKARCSNPKHKHYPYYGGKGITFCVKWETFTGFLEDMGEKPVGTSLDRIDNNGNYCKENCRWATATEQARNKSVTAFYTSNGITKPAQQWAEELGVNVSTLHERVARWGVDIGVSAPKKTAGERSTAIRITYDGKTQSLSQWAKELGLRYSTVVYRYHAGKSIETVLCKNLSQCQ